MSVNPVGEYVGDRAEYGGAAAQPETVLDWLQPRLGAILIALVLTGYPVVGAISSILGLPSEQLSIPFRVAVGAVAAASMVVAVIRGRVRIDWLVLIFLLLYLIRLLYDWGYLRSRDIDHALPFFLIAVVLPVLGLIGGRDVYDERRAAFWTMIIGTTACILVSYAILFTSLLSQQDYLNSDGRVALEALNPISLGYAGVYTAAAAVIVLVRQPPRWLALCALGAMPLSLFIVASAGARGPILALIIAGLILGLTNRRIALFVLLLAVPTGAAIAAFGLPEVLTRRFESAGTDESSIQRLQVLQLSIDAAKEYWLTGYAYIEPITGLYPHNLIVEGAFAMGIIGGVMMIIMQCSLLWRAITSAWSGWYFMPLIALCELTNGWLSATVSADAPFFVALVVLRQMARRTDQHRASIGV